MLTEWLLVLRTVYIDWTECHKQLLVVEFGNCFDLGFVWWVRAE